MGHVCVHILEALKTVLFVVSVTECEMNLTSYVGINKKKMTKNVLMSKTVNIFSIFGT